jgi:hypothetical protein
MWHKAYPRTLKSAILKHNHHRAIQESSDAAGATNTATTTASGYHSDESREIADELLDMDEDNDNADDATLPTSNEAGASTKTTSTTTVVAKTKRQDELLPFSEVQTQVQRTYAHHVALLQHVWTQCLRVSSSHSRSTQSVPAAHEIGRHDGGACPKFLFEQHDSTQ